jgi:hypothetical protein
MHNRNFIWHTQEGKKLILKHISSQHLINIIQMINKNELDPDAISYGNNTIKILNQELRYRKLNSIENNPDYKDIF